MGANYYAKRDARINRLGARAASKSAEADATLTSARRMSDAIPFGQPILVGHHSEKRDRRFRGRIHATYSKAFATDKQATRLAARAAAAASNRAISSDAPDAITRIEKQIADLNKSRDLAKQINAAVRKKTDAARREALAALDLKPTTIENALTPDAFGNLGVPKYVLTNTGANVRRLEKRLVELRALHAKATAQDAAPAAADTEIAPGVRVVENAADNRLQFIFDGKPAADVRAVLKSNGFKWAPSVGAWQRNLIGSYVPRYVAAVKRALGVG